MSTLTPLIPEAQTALEGFLQTLLGSDVDLAVEEPQATTFEDVMPEAIGYVLVSGTFGPNEGFTAVLEAGWIEMLSEAMLGEAMSMSDEGTADLVNELTAQAYGSIRNQLAASDVKLPEATYSVLAPGEMLSDENLPEDLYKIAFSYTHDDGTLKGFVLFTSDLPEAEPEAPAAPAPQAAASPPPQAAPGPQVQVARPSFPDLGQEQASTQPMGATFELLAEVELEVSVELGRRRLPLSEVLTLTTGSVIELEKLVGESLQVYANGRLIAEGEAVVIDEQFGVRITSLASARQRARAFL